MLYRIFTDVIIIVHFAFVLFVVCGLHTYESGFIERYILPLLYPAELTRSVQILLGVLLTGINVGIYWWIWHQTRQRRKNIL